MKKRQKNQTKAEEPSVIYRKSPAKKVITISTLEELKKLDREHTRKLTPEERMHYLYKLNENMYGFDLSRQAETLRKGEIIIRDRS